jgi:hypothetical protein
MEVQLLLSLPKGLEVTNIDVTDGILEGLSSWQVIMLVLIFLGILCASTNLAEVRGIVQKSGCDCGRTGNCRAASLQSAGN